MRTGIPCRSVAEFRAVVVELQKRYQPYHDGLLKCTGEEEEQPKQSEDAVADEPASAQPDCNFRLPPWLCQPYIRIPPEAHRQKLAEARRLAVDPTREKHQFFDVHGNEISRKRMKKTRRVQRRPKNRNRNAQKNDGQPVSNEGEENWTRHSPPHPADDTDRVSGVFSADSK
uniref:Uncharacterized protein n=1 Tax=Anopheles albimanus TaxID=7167 RepID=A0A182F2H1_ANOAL